MLIDYVIDFCGLAIDNLDYVTGIGNGSRAQYKCIVMLSSNVGYGCYA